jgi:hypothetical protein
VTIVVVERQQNFHVLRALGRASAAASVKGYGWASGARAD